MRSDPNGNEMALFPLFDSMAGCSGALAKGESYVPSQDGTRVYLKVADIERAIGGLKVGEPICHGGNSYIAPP